MSGRYRVWYAETIEGITTKKSTIVEQANTIKHAKEIVKQMKPEVRVTVAWKVEDYKREAME